MTVDAKGRTAAEFLTVEAAGAIMDRESIMAVMVVVVYAPKAGSTEAPTACRAWGAAPEDQATVLRKLAASMDREGVDTPASSIPIGRMN